MGFVGVCAFGGLPKLWPVWGCLVQALKKPLLLLLLLLYSRLFCDTLLLWTLGHPDHVGVWGLQGTPFPLSLLWSGGCPAPTSPTSSHSPGPLRFRHMSDEVTPAEAGMSLAAGGPSPPSDQVAGIRLREYLRGLFPSFLSPGRELSSQGCGCRFQTDGASPGAPQRAAAICLMLMWFTVYSYSLRMHVGNGLETHPQARLPGFEAQLCYLLAVWLWVISSLHWASVPSSVKWAQ